MTMTEQSPKLSGRARTATLATVLADLEGVDLTDAILDSANFEDVRNCDITRRLPGC